MNSTNFTFLRGCQLYIENKKKMNRQILSEIRDLKNLKAFPLSVKSDEILITSYIWNKVITESGLKFNPIDLLNEIYTDPLSAVNHLDSIINLIKLNILDSQTKRVTANSKNRVIRIILDKEMLFETEIFFTREFFKMLLFNKEIQRIELKGYKTNKEFIGDWFEYVSSVYELGHMRRGYFSPEDTQEELYAVAKNWQKIEKRRCKTKRKFPLIQLAGEYQLDHNEQIILVYLLKEDIEGNECDISELKELISQNKYELVKNQVYFEPEARLLGNGLIETVTKSGFRVNHEVRISMDIATRLLDEKSISDKSRLVQMLKGNDIFTLNYPKQDFKNLILEKEKKDVLLTGIDQYQNKVSETLKDWGIYDSKVAGNNSGLLILLYGPPGTGKTFSAHAISKHLNKPLLTTDISKLLSCWVGESEQNVRKLFNTYDNIYKRIDNSPVLLLNEADQFLTKRGEAQRSVDRMYNQMQNLFLEAFENFKGVLVCTTNLRDNLDPAFSRRFHLKLEFPFPKFEERKKLWKLHLPDTIPGVAKIDIACLAKHYELSGGQISVVIKNAATEAAGRKSREKILKQEDLKKFCLLELNSSFDNTQKKYGFAV